MSNTFLPNCSIDKDGNPVLSVGFTEAGHLARIGYTCESPYSFQQEVEVIHTKDIYDGEDPNVLEFFERSPDHPLYGILSDGISTEVLFQIQEFMDIINTKFPYQEKEGYPLVKDELLRVLVGTIGRYPDKTPKELFDVHVEISDTTEVSNHIVRLVNNAESYDDGGFSVLDVSVWYPDEDNKWVSNSLLQSPPSLRFGNVDEELMNKTVVESSTLIKLPKCVKHYHLVSRSVFWNGVQGQPPVTVVNITPVDINSKPLT